jgi:hypothetical protein
MEENAPDKGKVRNLSEVRRQKQNAGQRSIGVSVDGYLTYPDREVKITVEDALAAAQEILKHTSEQDLLEDYVERESRSTMFNWQRDEAAGGMEKEMRASLASQREYIQSTSIDDLVKIFDLYLEYPKHYYKTVLLAAAEALVSRFPKVEK